MSVHMRRNLHLLRALQKGKPQLRKAILKHTEPSCIKAICDCVLNILTSVVKLSAPQKRKLSKYKYHLRLLADKRISLKRKRQTLTQKGEGFLSLILEPVLKELVSLID